MSNSAEAGLAERLNEKLYRLFTLLALAFVVLNSFRPLMDNVDQGWHLAQGRWMAQHLSLYHHNIFNYPVMGQPFVNEYPLFQLLLFAAWSLGWWGPCLLTAAAYVWLLTVLIRTAQALKLEGSTLFALGLGLMLICLQVGAPLRPHLVTYLGIIFFGTFLLRHREVQKWTEFWPLIILQIAWTNCHSGFVIGPAMVGFFGAEMVLYQWLRDRAFPWKVVQTWLKGSFALLAACLVNPFGIARFYPPFYQDRLESIRAYVGEMEPLTGAAATQYNLLVVVAAVIVFLAGIRNRKFPSWSFLFLASVFYLEALTAKKVWPVLGLFVPLLLLSTGSSRLSDERRSGLPHWDAMLMNFLLILAMIMAFSKLFWGPFSLGVVWQEHDRGRTEISQNAIKWMQAHRLEGRLFHRCEDGGNLQRAGFDRGETFADTGWGKYNESFIHQAGLSVERPALLPLFFQAYNPEYMVCNNFCYRFPVYLRQLGWRLIFYSPNSSVWARPDVHPDLSTVSNDEVMATFDRDLQEYGLPVSTGIYGRNILTLHALGLEDFAFAKLRALPAEYHHAAWYWEAARFFCFEAPVMSAEHRDALLAEAEALHDDAVTLGFRAYCLEAKGDSEGAMHLLETVPSLELGDSAAELLLKIYLERKDPRALALARQKGIFDLRNGRHWAYLAEAEQGAGNIPAAAQAWQKAVFYYPDDAALMAKARQFAEAFHDESLLQAMTFTDHLASPSP